MKKINLLKRGLIFVLSLAMVLTSMAGFVFAEETVQDQAVPVEEAVAESVDDADDVLLETDAAVYAAEEIQTEEENTADEVVSLLEDETAALTIAYGDNQSASLTWSEIKAATSVVVTEEEPWTYGNNKASGTFYSFKSILETAGIEVDGCHGLKFVADDGFVTGIAASDIDSLYLYDMGEVLKNGAAAGKAGALGTAINGSAKNKWAKSVVSAEVATDHVWFVKGQSCAHYCAICGAAEPHSAPVWTWAEDFASASAAVTYNDCQTTVTVNAADITSEDKGLYQVYTASAALGSETLTATANNLPQSAHPYENSYDNTWTFPVEGATAGILVTFDENTKTENNYDFIYLYDENDQEIGKYSGTALAGKTLYLTANTLKIRLTSDRSSNAYGFALTDLQAAVHGDLVHNGSIDKIPSIHIGEDAQIVVRAEGKVLTAGTDYEVAYDNAVAGTNPVTVTGKGDYFGTLTAEVNVVDADHLLDGPAVAENAQVSLRMPGDTGSSYISFASMSDEWFENIDTITFTPVNKDGTEYTAHPYKTVTVKKEDLSVRNNYVYFNRTAEKPVVYVEAGHDPLTITNRWGTTLTYNSQDYKVEITATDFYKPVSGIVTYYTGTAPSFSIIVDADGNDKTTDDQEVVKSWNEDEIKAMAVFANGSSQCGMTGFRTFSGEGVSLVDLLKAANVEVSDDDYFLLDTTDHYGNKFTYDDLFGVDRYFMSTIYEDGFYENVYSKLVEEDDQAGATIALRKYLAEQALKNDSKVLPRINVNYVETMLSGETLKDAQLPTKDNTEYNSLVAFENQYRFFYGIKLVQDECTVTFNTGAGSEVPAQTVKSHYMTSTENSTMKSSYWANSLVIYRGAGKDYKTTPSAAADKITKPEDPTCRYLTFAGWYTDEACTEGNEFDFEANDGTVDTDITLYAKWEDPTVITIADAAGNETEIKASQLLAAESVEVTKDAPWHYNDTVEAYGTFYSVKSLLSNAGIDVAGCHGLKFVASDGFVTGIADDQIDSLYIYDMSEVTKNGAVAGDAGTYGLAINGSAGNKWASDVVRAEVATDHVWFVKGGKCRHTCSICGEAEPYSGPVWTWNEDRTSASAAFTYEDCKTTETVEAAEVKSEDKGQFTVYSATVTFDDQEFTGTTNTLPQSAHPYVENADESWEYTVEGAENGIIVTFSEDTKTESGYDFIYVYDADDNELGKFSGTELAGESIYVPTATVKIKLTSDRSGNDYGFSLENVEANGDTVDLAQFGKIEKIAPVKVGQTPVFDVTLNGNALKAGDDYTAEYDTSAAGVATLKITGAGKYSGELEKEFVVYANAIKITDFDIANAEHDDADEELNQTIIATVTFDSDIKLEEEEDLAEQLLITIAGGDAFKTARDISFKADGNKLIITMVSNGWVAIYNGVLAISDAEEALTAVKGAADGDYIVWEPQSANIPIGITLKNWIRTTGTEKTAASTVVTVTHKANMRGMYHFELVSIKDGVETVIGKKTSHAHNFYGSITKEAIASAMASGIDSLEGYTTTYNADADYFTVKADSPVAGETLAVRMYEIKSTITYDEGASITIKDAEGNEHVISESAMFAAETEEVTADAPWTYNETVEAYGTFISVRSLLEQQGISVSDSHGLKFVASDGFVTGIAADQIDKLYIYDMSEVTKNGAVAGKLGTFGLAINGSAGNKWASDVVSGEVAKDHVWFVKGGKCRHTCTICGENEPFTVAWQWNGVESAKAVLTYDSCGTVEEVEATVTSEVTTEPKSAEEPGVRTYTATAVINKTDYTDSVTEEIPWDYDWEDVKKIQEEADQKVAEAEAAKAAAEEAKAAAEEAQKEAEEKAAAAEAAKQTSDENAAAAEAAKLEAQAAAAEATAAAEAAQKIADEKTAAAEAAQQALTDAQKAAEDAQKAADEKLAAAEAAQKDAEAKALEAAAAQKAAEEKAAAAALKKGTKVLVGNNIYKVTNASKKTVSFVGTIAKGKTVKIPATVKVNGVKYKVTAVDAKALKGNTTVTSVTIGSNVTSIGKNAFNGCKKLKTIKVSSKKIKKVQKGAFKGISAKATVKVPKAKLKAYKKLFKKGGLPKKAKVK